MLGVTEDVGAVMAACGASSISEDNLLLRRCACGIFHPVGHLGRSLDDRDWTRRHHTDGQPAAFIRFAKCCGCCEAWPHHAPQPMDTDIDVRKIEREEFERLR